MWLRTLLLFLLVILLLRFVMRLVRGVAEGMSAGGTHQAARTKGQPPVKMVADPVCGTYVVPGKALQASRGRDTHYFCSAACRDKWERHEN
jgi:YHS domain-containing protein